MPNKKLILVILKKRLNRKQHFDAWKTHKQVCLGKLLTEKHKQQKTRDVLQHRQTSFICSDAFSIFTFRTYI